MYKELISEKEVFQLHANAAKRLQKVPTGKTAFCGTIISSLLGNGSELFVVSKCPLLVFFSCSSIHSSLAALPDTLHAGKSNEFNWSGIHKAAPVPQASRRQGPLPGVMSGTGTNPPQPSLPNCYVCQLTAHTTHTTLPRNPTQTTPVCSGCRRQTFVLPLHFHLVAVSWVSQVAIERTIPHPRDYKV